MRIFINVIIGIWIIIWCWAGIDILFDTPNIIKKHEEQISIWFGPSIKYVENYKFEYSKLPTNSEFNNWCYQGRILPSQGGNFILDFYKRNNRNPTEEESLAGESDKSNFAYTEKQLDSISKTDGMLFLITKSEQLPEEYKSTQLNWGTDYLLGSIDEEGETFYYQSWNKKNTYSWNWLEGFYGLISIWFIGVIPLFIKIIISKLQKTIIMW